MGRKDLSQEANGDWLADIFDAVEDGVITGLEMDGDLALPEDAIAALQPENEGGENPRTRRSEARLTSLRVWALTRSTRRAAGRS